MWKLTSITSFHGNSLKVQKIMYSTLDKTLNQTNCDVWDFSWNIWNSGESRRNDTAGLTQNQIPFLLTDLNNMKRSEKTLNQTICSVKFLLETYEIHVYFLFFFFHSFMIYWLVHCCILLISLAITTNLQRNLRWGSEMVMVQDKSKSMWSGCCACDSRWKVPTIRHLRGLEHDLPPCDFSQDSWWLELSICYHTYQPLSHTFFLTFVPQLSPSHSITQCHRHSPSKSRSISITIEL